MNATVQLPASAIRHDLWQRATAAASALLGREVVLPSVDGLSIEDFEAITTALEAGARRSEGPDDVLHVDGERVLDRQAALDLADRYRGKDADLDLALAALIGQDRQIHRLGAILEGRFADVQLIDCNLSPREFSLALQDGPIPYLVEYLAQMLGHRQSQEPSNYVALDVQHHELGAMTLTLSRRNGKSAHVVAAEHLGMLNQVKAMLDASQDIALVCEKLNTYLKDLPAHQPSEPT